MQVHFASLARTPIIRTQRLTLFYELQGWEQPLATFFGRNLEFFKPWDPPQPSGLTNPQFHATRLQGFEALHLRNEQRRFVMTLHEQTNVIVGRIGYSSIVRGAFHSCMLGYAIDQAHQGKGLMHEALQASVAHMFGVENLHRIQANYRPENTRSGVLLERLGFIKEGLSRDYLFIDGAWRDHVLTAKHNPDWTQPEMT